MSLLLQNTWETCILIKCWDISVHSLEWRQAPEDKHQETTCSYIHRTACFHPFFSVHILR